MGQASFAELEHDLKTRRMRRAAFLEKMDGLVPRGRLEERIEPFYPKAGRGRRPYPAGAMLRAPCVPLFCNLSDPGMEDLLCEVGSVRRFVGLRLSGSLPDETTIANFRHLLEEPDPGDRLFGEIDAPLATPGHRLKTGTIADASIVAAPSSTKNRKRAENREAAVDWQVAMKPGKRRQWDKAGPEEAAERRKASVRAKVEHPFLYVKRRFGYAKVRYRGLAKNRQRIAVLLGLYNPLIAGRRASKRPFVDSKTMAPVPDRFQHLHKPKQQPPCPPKPDLFRPSLAAEEGYPVLVPAVDSDGNEIAGVRAPMIGAPVGTFAGWNIRRRGIGGGAMHEFSGSYIPFPDTPEERAATGDPRPSLLERYGDAAGHVRAVEAAARKLVEDGFMLEEDLPRVVARAQDWGRPLTDVRLP